MAGKLDSDSGSEAGMTRESMPLKSELEQLGFFFESD